MIDNTQTKKILKSLTKFDCSIEELEQKMALLEWDIPDYLVTLNKKYVKNILYQFIDNKLTQDDIERWANLLEGRDGIKGLESPQINDIIHELANPDLHPPLTSERAKKIIKLLYS